jgi:hypothetical protein
MSAAVRLTNRRSFAAGPLCSMIVLEHDNEMVAKPIVTHRRCKSVLLSSLNGALAEFPETVRACTSLQSAVAGVGKWVRSVIS